jgi:RhtB (resistance to homoserine/threonine) family protein
MIELLHAYLPSIISLTCLQLVALISPGPDFAVVVRNSLIYSRKTTMITAFGVALGVMVHITYIMLGLGFVIAETKILFEILKYTGAAYLVYIGYKGIRANKHELNLSTGGHLEDISAINALKSGFLTNALNPKAMLFFLSVFSIVVQPNTPAFIMIIYSVIIFLTTLAWFGFVALCLSGKMKKIFSSYNHWIERVTGCLLILIGIRLLFISAK